ncbi:uncharacterized protein LOC130841594 [Hippopotamus amphibius kiboko]|uniref:uncharacterized protein LOC130841594 n=1 Tax=Hippopotamus amphibius kiboko TaxID=575201 RepID=UPI00259A47BD|nr:uncharacterized protein LOC130841594 [Hippopotamus amphibius kiboko]XP_057573685.1 uncharacterized protein LOC130841594 [Hippopotamus amphibius kiboko]XP_057573686.1 uncharacterized protein LOC130841594 [Hippopotamus amphibius kiboko]XP_057573687.1 uncharacterized protein LOC130841594 [Hippopotamus amphibius kiboko]XP_057573688.1 uncharacterized protein LOC130841594 [Hippopotamus amphibius kiboko]
MNSQGHKWLTNARMTHYQGLLCENPRVHLETVRTLNPAIFLPTEAGTPDHNCEEVLGEIYLSRPDLMDTPLQNPELELFSDGSSFVQEGQHKAGYTITTTDEIIKAEPLPQGWSAQRAELRALIQAIRHAEGKRANIDTDSRYAFATLHGHGAIYKERGLLTAGEKEIKNKKEILPLKAVWKPSQVAVIHCKGHQRGTDLVSWGYRLADQVAKEVATQPNPTMSLEPNSEILLAPELPSSLRYTIDQWALSEGGTKGKEGWWKLLDQRLFVPSTIAIQLVKQHHETTHLGKTVLESLLSCYYFVPKLPTLCAQISATCVTCARNNASQRPRPSPGVQTVGTLPLEDLEVDFTEIKPCWGYRYLLVIVCTYLGWAEAYPTRTERA